MSDLDKKIKAAISRIKKTGFDERIITFELLEMYTSGIRYTFRELQWREKVEKVRGKG